jgi:HK97 family phage major capsid protein
LREFNTEADPYIFVPNRPSAPGVQGGPTFDGFPIVWTDVLEPYGTAAAAAKFLAVFGVLEYWWFGEHGQPRLDVSSDVYFATDELAARFIEEIDFDYQDVGATASLQTAAS